MTALVQTTTNSAPHAPPATRVGGRTLLQLLSAVLPWLTLAAIITHGVLRLVTPAGIASQIPLMVALAFGTPMILARLIKSIVDRQMGADLLAGVSIVTAIFLGQYLAGTFIVLMLSGGEWLENYARRTASGVLDALARRMPTLCHKWNGVAVEDVPVGVVRPGDRLLVMPHEICPADGVVIEGRGSMDESYLTGEPYGIAKATGSDVLSGAMNGNGALTIRVVRAAADSRYAQITQVMREAEARRIKLQRIGDRLGVWFTVFAFAVALAAWGISGDPIRFLAVVVVATPCPVILAIPVAIIGTISLCARRGIVIRDAGILEHLDTCRTLIFDKTGTLTVGEPKLVDVYLPAGHERNQVLQLAASIEQYSRHPLAPAVLEAAAKEHLDLLTVEDVHEPPGFGLRARIGGQDVVLTGRKHLQSDQLAQLPPHAGGLECIVLIDNHVAGLLRFQDEPREDTVQFIAHLGPRHQTRRLILLTGDRATEARRIARLAGITEVLAEKSPEEKLAIVREETSRNPTLFIGDGVNDAPALMAATIGIAMGAKTDVAAAAAGAVILEPTLRKVDELTHIARRLRRIVLQSAAGGMAISVIAIGFAATGHLSPVAGAVLQEVIDLAAILNALRAAFVPKILSDM